MVKFDIFVKLFIIFYEIINYSIWYTCQNIVYYILEFMCGVDFGLQT